MGKRQKPRLNRDYGEIPITREQRQLARNRTAFLLDGVGVQSMPIADLLGNAYVQGLIDATEVFERQALQKDENRG